MAPVRGLARPRCGRLSGGTAPNSGQGYLLMRHLHATTEIKVINSYLGNQKHAMGVGDRESQSSVTVRDERPK